MNLLKTADELRNWEEYREFLKRQLKLVEDEGPCFVSKEKQTFEVEGKPWKGHAILVGPKAELAMKQLRKEGVLFRVGAFQRVDKVLELGDLMPKLVKESAKTMLKLRLGWKVRESVEGELADDLEASWNEIKAKLAPYIKGALNGGIEAVEELKQRLQEAAGFEKAGDYGAGVEAMKDIAKFIASATGAAAAGAAGAAAGAAAAAAADQGVTQEEAAANLAATGKSIRGSVGKGGDNDAADVTLVQRWLNNHGLRTKVSGDCDTETIKAILKYQRDVVRLKKPDGVVDPRGRTERQLKRKPIRYDGEAETQTEQDLKEFFAAFNGVPVRINPGQEPPQYVDVVPPYHINSGGRKKSALEARKENSAVHNLVKKLPALARVGKADPEDIKSFLEAAIQKGLVTNKTQKGLRDFLALYGVSTDCSGLVGQALNFLTDGDLENEKGDAIDSMNVGADSMKGGTSKFAKVTKPSDLTAGDTMHTPGHIRIIVDVDRDGDMTLFRTIESTPREDVVGGVSDGKKGTGADGGVGDILWRYDQSSKFSGLERSADDGKTWHRSKDSSVTYGRWKKMPAA